MSKEMKYEAVFGDQSLFDMSGDFDVLAVLNGKSLFCFNEKELKTLNKSICKQESSTAMRRIIAEPKRWTVEDQKAGRLPEVGAELLHESEGYVNFVGEFDFRWMLRTKEGGLYLAEKFYCSPIETPEEKAERLRSEWIQQSCYDLVQPTEKAKELAGFIYDALLSGALSVPTKGGE